MNYIHNSLFIYQSYHSVNVEQEISYSKFKELLHNNQIVSVVVRPDLIRGRHRANAYAASVDVTNVPKTVDSEIMPLFMKKRGKLAARHASA